MPRLTKQQKTDLGETIGAWYRNFGKVNPRRAYHDDEESGTGAAGAVPPWEAHPLFMDMPIGASSDLASILVNDERTLDLAEEREKEACPELKNQLNLAMKQRLAYQQTARALPTLKAY